MSSPGDRLVGDEAAQRFEIEAFAIMACPQVLPQLQDLAAAVILLCRDRQARQELSAAAEGTC